MKELKLIGSVLNGSNKVVSDGDADWRGVKEGNLIKFKADEIFYYAAKSEPLFYIKDFRALDNHTLIIDDFVDLYLNVGDNLTVSYKEYELLTIFNILDGGRNYKIGDILFLEGGVASHSVEDGFEQKCHLRVEEILPGGIIQKLSIENKGKYIETPEEKVKIKGGTGTGGIIEVKFKLLDSRALVEKDIAKIEKFNESQSKIVLNYPIPKSVKEGKISIKKYCLTLSTNYQGKEKNAELFEVIRDFTPNIYLPLLISNSFARETLINQAFITLDKTIKELKEEIEELRARDPKTN